LGGAEETHGPAQANQCNHSNQTKRPTLARCDGVLRRPDWQLRI